MTWGQMLHEWQKSPSGTYATSAIKTNSGPTPPTVFLLEMLFHTLNSIKHRCLRCRQRRELQAHPTRGAGQG
eukprot:8355792-Prorocentrum_lima.AAC.1